MARRKLSSRVRRRLQLGFVVASLLLLLAALITVAVLDRRVTAQFEGRRWTLPARVYAQPVDLYVGQTLSAERFAFELDRLGYLAVRAVNRPGTYRRRGQRVEVNVRAFRFSDELQPARSLKLAFNGDRIAELVDAQGVDIPVYRLDPLLIGSIFPVHGEDRIVVSPDQVPECFLRRSRRSRTASSISTTASTCRRSCARRSPTSAPARLSRAGAR
jgi:penicillin-binding protein 1B